MFGKVTLLAQISIYCEMIRARKSVAKIKCVTSSYIFNAVSHKLCAALEF